LQDLQYAVRVEPFMEPSGSERTIQIVRNGAGTHSPRVWGSLHWGS
jgi:hypothetical protein